MSGYLNNTNNKYGDGEYAIVKKPKAANGVLREEDRWGDFTLLWGVTVADIKHLLDSMRTDSEYADITIPEWDDMAQDERTALINQLRSEMQFMSRVDIEWTMALMEQVEQFFTPESDDEAIEIEGRC